MKRWANFVRFDIVGIKRCGENQSFVHGEWTPLFVGRVNVKTIAFVSVVLPIYFAD